MPAAQEAPVTLQGAVGHQENCRRAAPSSALRLSRTIGPATRSVTTAASGRHGAAARSAASHGAAGARHFSRLHWPLLAHGLPGRRRATVSRDVIHPGKPVLVVEDHDDTRYMVEMFLLQDGYDVVCASNGAEALEFVAKARPCLILLDVNMPVMDGPAFARRLRAHPDRTLADTPIVLLTAVPNASEIQREIGAVAAVSKPISFDRVMEMVARHCPFCPP